MRSITFILCGLILAATLSLVTNGRSAFAAGIPSACLEHPAFIKHPNYPLVSRMMGGFNLPNWDHRHPQERPDWQTLIRLKEAGFTHVRLPLFHDAFVTGNLKSSELQSYLEWMVRDVKRLNLIGYAVSLDFHPSKAFNNTLRLQPLLGLSRLREAWRAIAKHVALLPERDVAVEILNEPDVADMIWQRALPSLVEVVREELPDHTIIVPPFGPQRHETLFTMKPLEDRNVLYAVHYYDPFFFTHQGADWFPKNNPVRALKGISFPIDSGSASVIENRKWLTSTKHREALDLLERQLQKPWDGTRIKAAFIEMKNWSENSERMILVNEFGVLSHHTPHKARLNWLNEVVSAAKETCIGWAHWEYSDGFGFFDPSTKRPDPSILNSLLSNKK